MSLSLGNSGFELRHQIGPWPRSTLYRIGLAVEATGAAKSEEQAHALVWDAIDAAGEHVKIRDALERAGVDVPAVNRRLQVLEDDYVTLQRAEELDLLRQADREMRV